MIKRKVKALLYLFFIVVIITACDGRNRESGQYNLSGLSSIAFRLVNVYTSEFHPDEEKFAVEGLSNLTDTIAIRYDSLGIDIATSNEYILLSQHLNNLNLIQSCYANSGIFQFEKIIDIVVTSNKDYSIDYPSGTDLSEIMRISYYHLANGTDFHSFISSYNYMEKSSVLIRFISPPDNDDVHTITIKYITENHNEFETSQGQLLITK